MLKDCIMKKIVRLTETDLSNIVRQIIKEASGTPIKVAAKKGTYIDPTGKTIAANKLPTELNPGQKLGGMSPDAELLILYSQSGGAAKYVTIKSDTKNLSYENLAYLAVKSPQKTLDVVQRSGVVQRESDLARIVKRVLSEEMKGGPGTSANVASTTSVNKLSTTGGPKPVNLVPSATACLKGYVMDKTQKYYQKQNAKAWQDRKVYPSGKWSKNTAGKVQWGSWKCSGNNILFDIPNTDIGKTIKLDNGNLFSDNDGRGAYSVGGQGWQTFGGKIISKTPDPQFNGYRIKIKGIGGGSLFKAGPKKNGHGCVSTLTDYLKPKGGGNFEQSIGFEVEAC